MNTKFYKIVRPLIKGLFTFLYRPKILGSEYLLEKESYVLAGNHTEWLDPAFLISSVPRQVHFLAKDSLFRGILGFFVKRMGCIPVNRKIHDKSALKEAEKGLLEEKVIGIFPEGTINRTDDLLLPFKIGAVKMSCDTNRLLIPFVITGKYRLFRSGLCIQFLRPRIIKKDLEDANHMLMKDIKKQLEDHYECN